jgi:protein involved in polysaccharide export with SLBB domain
MDSSSGGVTDTTNWAVIVVKGKVAVSGNKDANIASSVQDYLNLSGGMLILNNSKNSTLTSRDGRQQGRTSNANRKIGMRKRCEKW